MSSKYKKIKGYFDNGFWTKVMVGNAVEKGQITAEEYAAITGEDYESLSAD